MSNGGGMQLMTLSKVLAKRPGSSRRPPGLGPVALVLDSLPDGDGLRCMIVIYTSQTKNPIAKYAAVPLLAFLYSLFYLSYGNPPVLQEVRQRLNTPNLLPGFSASDASTGTDATPRLYVYSDADKMTRIAEVDSHVEEARRRGFDVRTEMFDKTAHVSHAKGDPERYWNAVADIWRKARTRCEPKLSAKL
ncbi:hypothetical protein PHLCEN_2v10379 [Hermanssonia centrifuga]|uniref:Uncharacterized protein n=1 Tax=Hermanssonia centrifuga TaxID=98765 RepID=A0A2R6NNE3_9APHY|nr:hypothetical protein PHLCEN_2v10379 [Hermanssonia centrifuga]